MRDELYGMSLSQARQIARHHILEGEKALGVRYGKAAPDARTARRQDHAGARRQPVSGGLGRTVARSPPRLSYI